MFASLDISPSHDRPQVSAAAGRLRQFFVFETRGLQVLFARFFARQAPPPVLGLGAIFVRFGACIYPGVALATGPAALRAQVLYVRIKDIG